MSMDEDVKFDLNMNDLDKFNGSNRDPLIVMQNFRKQNDEYIQELMKYRNPRDIALDSDRKSYKPPDMTKLYDALVSVLELTPEIKDKGDIYYGTWETENSHALKDSLDTLIEVLDKRYKRLD